MAADSQSRYLWLDREIVAWEKATINITAVGHLSTAATVFEGIRAYWNGEQRKLFVFRLQEHMRRFADSMMMQYMDQPYTQEELAQAIVDLLTANGLEEDTYISPRAFFDPFGPWGAFIEDPSSIRILIDSWPRPSRLPGGEPIHCCVSSWNRISDNVMPPRIKCLSNFQNSLLALGEAKRNGYDGAIMLERDGKVSEGPAACLFIIRDGVAISPSITSSILESITRKTLIELFCEELGVSVVEREVDRTELYVADEAFFCGTGGGEVTPIISIDRHTLRNASPGPLTRAIGRLYHDVVRGKNSRYERWLTETPRLHGEV